MMIRELGCCIIYYQYNTFAILGVSLRWRLVLFGGGRASPAQSVHRTFLANCEAGWPWPPTRSNEGLNKVRFATQLSNRQSLIVRGRGRTGHGERREASLLFQYPSFFAPWNTRQWQTGVAQIFNTLLFIVTHDGRQAETALPQYYFAVITLDPKQLTLSTVAPSLEMGPAKSLQPFLFRTNYSAHLDTCDTVLSFTRVFL